LSDSVSARIAAAGRAIGLYAAGSLAAGVVGFFALPFFTRIFTPDDFGVIGLFTAVVGLLTPGLSLAGYIFILYNRQDSRGVSEAIGLIAVTGAVLVSTVASIVWLTGSMSTVAYQLTLLAIVTGFANVWVMIRLHRYQAEQSPGRFFWLSAAPPVLAFGLTLVLATHFGGWSPRIWALVLVSLGTASWAVGSLRRLARLSLRAGFERIRQVARFGGPIVIHTASIWIVGFTDRFIIAEREGLAAAGIYTVAYSIGLGVSAAHDGVARYFASRLPDWIETKSGRIDAARFSYRYAAAAILSLPLTVPIALLGLEILTTDDFGSGSDLLLWLIPAQTLAGVARVFTGYLYVEQRTAQRAALSASEAGVNLPLTWVLVGALGVVGAAVATLATYLLSSIGTYVLARTGDNLTSVAIAFRRRSA
jgi:O-antigen/teichoic acid export membrane protein